MISQAGVYSGESLAATMDGELVGSEEIGRPTRFSLIVPGME